MIEYIALIRGINVGRAKRIAMAELRELVGSLGYELLRFFMPDQTILMRPVKSSRGKMLS